MIEKRVSRDTALIRDSILNSLRGVESIVLTGSIARDEVSYFVRDNEVVLLSDYDLVVVIKDYAFPLALSKVKELESRASTSLKSKVSIGVVPRFFWKRAPRTAFYYGVRKTGRVLYGKNVLHEIPVSEPQEIDKKDGLSILFNYLNQLLKVYVPPDENPTWTEPVSRLQATSVCNRSLLACLEALLVLEGQYHPSLERRMELMETELRRDFVALEKTLPGISRRIQTAFKARGMTSFRVSDSKQDFHTLWFDAKETVLESIRHCLKKYLGLSREDDSFLLNEYLQSSNGRESNIQFFALMLALRKRLLPNSLFSHISMRHRFQCSAFWLASSLEAEGMSEEKVRHAKELLRPCLRKDFFSDNSAERSWWHFKTELANNWKYACPVLGM